MSGIARWGGIAASIVLILMSVALIGVGIAGRDTVRDDLAREQIVGTPDSAIPNQTVDTGGEAKEFAATIRKHTLEATGDQTYAQMGRFLDASGNPTEDEAAAAKDPKTGQPVETPAGQQAYRVKKDGKQKRKTVVSLTSSRCARLVIDNPAIWS